MISRRRLTLVLLASSAVSLGTAIPASADHSAEHASDQISGVVASAEGEMDGIVSGFATHIEGLSDEGQVDQAAGDVTTTVEEVWTTSRTAIDDLVTLFPGQLGQVGGEAKQQLQGARQTARTTISDLADAWVPPIAVPSPTTTTTTTTTVADNGTTPAKDPGPGPGNGPGSDLGNGNGNGNGPDPSKDPAPDQAVAPPVDPSPAPDPPAAPETEVDEIGIDFELASATPEQPFTVSPEAITTLLAAEDTGATATMAEMLRTVLSPAVVDLVLSPLLVLEILLRTLVDGGLRLVAPLAMLVISALAIFGYDRISKRNLFPERV